MTTTKNRHKTFLSIEEVSGVELTSLVKQNLTKLVSTTHYTLEKRNITV